MTEHRMFGYRQAGSETSMEAGARHQLFSCSMLRSSDSLLRAVETTKGF